MSEIATLKSQHCTWSIGEDGVYSSKNEEEDVEYTVYWETNGYTIKRNGDVLGFDLSFDQANQVYAIDFALGRKFEEQMENEPQAAG